MDTATDQALEASGRFCPTCQILRDFQRERLQATAKMLATALPTEVIQVDGSLGDEDLTFYTQEASLSIRYHPEENPSLRHVLSSSYIPRRALDDMRVALRQKPQLKSRYCSVEEIVVEILSLVEDLIPRLLEYRIDVVSKQTLLAHDDLKTSRFAKHLDFEDIHDSISSLVGIKPKAVLESVASILKQEGDSFWTVSRIAHCESVVRKDLSAQFMRKREEMSSHLWELSAGELKRSVPTEARRLNGSEHLRKEQLIHYLTTPKLTFHGTLAATVGSIVQNGFLKPGDKHPKTGWSLPVRCGSTYGRGIYSSPSAAFSLAYSGIDAAATRPADLPGQKLIVCATLMGRAATISHANDWRSKTQPYPGSDSHVTGDNCEYIVFDSAQILPLYVVHLDWGADNETVLESIRADARSWSSGIRQKRMKADGRQSSALMFPGDKQRAKEERLAQGRKFLAYGFGPVSGDRLVIKEVAQVDDDEEDYGDYQQNRIDLDPSQHSKALWEWDSVLEGEDKWDVYTEQRRAKGVKWLKGDELVES